MAAKKYSSYAQIDADLEILKLEREIHYQKMVYSVQKAKQSLTPTNLIVDLIGSSASILKGSSGSLLKTIAAFIIRKVFKIIKKLLTCKNKKRGN